MSVRQQMAADRVALNLPTCPRCGDLTEDAICRCGEPMTELAAARARRAKAIRDSVEQTEWAA